jgi:putative methionine-R-sulfoxide reductase with GAF domain/anti-sigma regulatory factor (Ser/Thr protein kinase)
MIPSQELSEQVRRDYNMQKRRSTGHRLIVAKVAELMRTTEPHLLTQTAVAHWVAATAAEVLGKKKKAYLRVAHHGKKILEIRGQDGRTVDGAENLAWTEGLCGLAMEARDTKYCHDKDSDTEEARAYKELDPATRSNVAVPVFVRLRKSIWPAAVLNVESPEVNGFSSEDIELCESIADAAAAVLQMSVQQTGNSLAAKAIEQTLVSALNVGRAGHDVLREMQEPIRLLLENTKEWVQYSHLEVVMLYDDYVHVVYSTHPDETGTRVHPLEECAISLLDRNAPAVTAWNHFSGGDAPKDAAGNLIYTRASPRSDAKTESALVVPITENGKLIGAINLESPKRDSFVLESNDLDSIRGGSFFVDIIQEAAARLGPLCSLLDWAYAMHTQFNVRRKYIADYVKQRLIGEYKHQLSNCILGPRNEINVLADRLENGTTTIGKVSGDLRNAALTLTGLYTALKQYISWMDNDRHAPLGKLVNEAISFSSKVNDIVGNPNVDIIAKQVAPNAQNALVPSRTILMSINELVRNATKHAANEGPMSKTRIEVSARLESQCGEIPIVRAPRGVVVVRIADNGPGLPQEIKQALDTKFKYWKGSRAVTDGGLGILGVFYDVLDVGGVLSYESGKGAILEIKVPASLEPSEAKERNP